MRMRNIPKVVGVSCKYVRSLHNASSGACPAVVRPLCRELKAKELPAMSLTEKDLSVDSQDEDSGHDSADSLAAGPVDDRERIVHLETAVAWIKEEMVSSSVELL
jgi:hypothetical protein